MSVFSGPRIVANGLILNIQPFSLKNQTCFSTSFLTNGNFFNGAGVTQESGSNPTNTVLAFPNPGDSPFVLRQSGEVSQFTEYQLNLGAELVASTTYVMSGWYAESPDYSCADGSRMFHARTFSSSGNHIATGVGIGTVLREVNINGIKWKYCYQTIDTPSDYNSVFNWYVGYGGSAYTGYRYYTNLKVERGTFPSLYDHSGRNNHHRFEGSATYNSTLGRFTFDGSTSKIVLPNALSGATSTCTVQYFYATTDTQELWIRGNLNNSVYLSASSGNNYYHSGVGSPTNFVDLKTTLNPATPINYRDGNFHMWEAKGVDLTGWTYFEWGGYPLGWQLTGTVGNFLIYDRNLTSEESAINFNAFRGRFGI